MIGRVENGFYSVSLDLDVYVQLRKLTALNGLECSN